MLTEPIQTAIEDVIYDYCCGKATGSDVHTTLKYLGYRVDLRKWMSNKIEITNVDRTQAYIIEV
jgi:hypothetical protein